MTVKMKNPTQEKVEKEVIDWWSNNPTKKEIKKLMKELKEHDGFTPPGDYRIIKDIIWEKVSKKPIIIEVKDGLVQDVRNIPDGYEYIIKDYDDVG
jgi:hypothetical protein